MVAHEISMDQMPEVRQRALHQSIRENKDLQIPGILQKMKKTESDKRRA